MQLLKETPMNNIILIHWHQKEPFLYHKRPFNEILQVKVLYRFDEFVFYVCLGGGMKIKEVDAFVKRGKKDSPHRKDERMMELFLHALLSASGSFPLLFFRYCHTHA